MHQHPPQKQRGSDGRTGPEQSQSPATRRRRIWVGTRASTRASTHSRGKARLAMRWATRYVLCPAWHGGLSTFGTFNNGILEYLNPKYLKAFSLNTPFREFSRSVREIFAKFSKKNRSFRKFYEVFGLALTCPDLFGCVRMRSDASGCVRMHSDAFGKNRKNWSKNFNFSISQFL